MSDLTVFRDHARRLAALTEPVMRRVWTHNLNATGRPGWTQEVEHPVPTDAERALWTRLADEADAYLNRHPEETLL